ncbi:MAG: phosphonate C-P lyase system protein PhnG [Sphingomonadaceae bacterium]
MNTTGSDVDKSGFPDGRRHWMSVLAKAEPEELLRAWEAIPAKPEFSPLRPVETGLVLVRGRMGGTGDAFNLGEMTVTRAAVRIASGEVGMSYVAGRDRRHAEIAAVVDAMMQSPRYHEEIKVEVVDTLDEARRIRKDELARKAAATKVDFFTMVR